MIGKTTLLHILKEDFEKYVHVSGPTVLQEMGYTHWSSMTIGNTTFVSFDFYYHIPREDFRSLCSRLDGIIFVTDSQDKQRFDTDLKYNLQVL